jgi:hypothetical protein
VRNLTRKSILAREIFIVDITLAPFTALTQLDSYTGKGIWLTPYNGIPATRWFPHMDLVYLDENYKVIQLVESVLSVFVEPLVPQAKSVLVLPAKTISSSQTKSTDQLLVCGAEEMKHRLESLSSPFARVPMMGKTDPLPNAPQPIGDSTSSLSGEHSLKLRNEIEQPAEKDRAESEAPKREPFMTRLLRWLATDRRKARRFPFPGLVAYYWTGGAPKACQIGDISTTGLYIVTEERWLPGSVIPMTLQRANTSGEAPDDWIAVQTYVVRSGIDGQGLALVFSKFRSPKSCPSPKFHPAVIRRGGLISENVSYGRFAIFASNAAA